MIRRVVAVRLKEKYRGAADVAAISKQSAEVFERSELILGYEIGTPSDAHTAREWQLMFILTLENQAAVDQWRTDPLHRAFADQFLAPLRDRIRVWNMTVGKEGI